MPESGISLRKIAAAAIVAAGACLVTAILVLGLDNKTATDRDYIQYWALEQQYAHGANPFDAAAILRIQRAAGMDKPSVLMSLGPPVAFFFALPLGWVSAKTGLVMWMLLLMACMGASLWVLWLLHGRPESRWHLIGLGFPPALWCLISGQLGIFFLLDIVLFLYFIRRRPWLAGAALVLCALKPHLFLPCAVVLALWSLRRREMGVLGGFAAAVAVSCGLTLWIDPHAWGQYVRMLHTTPIMDQLLPTMSVGLRFLVDRHAHWIEFIPEAGACIWAGWYYITRREHWDWNREGMLLLLVGVVFSPYSWYSDQALLFPAVLAGLYRAQKSAPALALFGVVAGAGLVGVLAQIPMTSPYYMWTAPALLLWYLYAMRGHAAVADAAPGAEMAL